MGRVAVLISFCFSGTSFCVAAGLGHTSSIPFDREHGWYRGLRGLAGEVTYTAQVKMWSPNTHRVFPQNMQQAARSLIMCALPTSLHSEAFGCLLGAGNLFSERKMACRCRN